MATNEFNVKQIRVEVRGKKDLMIGGFEAPDAIVAPDCGQHTAQLVFDAKAASAKDLKDLKKALLAALTELEDL